MILITVNNTEYDIVLEKEITILQICKMIGIDIPRFCYHERLSIAGNCRMCLVEVSKVNKPVVACALPIVDGMQIFTKSLLVKKVRESILEFLLVNHPLDCPICDQGGECDLQDQTMLFGNDRGRFYDIKRSVEDKNCGPFIKTIMTRCIHCTRCVRFATEMAGINELGILGRGNKMEIGTYIEKTLNSEISGNLIDLCPVGALTSKPYAFTTRSWELNSVESIDIFDSLYSNIRIDIRGKTIMRILPKINDLINEEWITDKIRFIYDSFYNNRLEMPLLLIKNFKKSYFISINWFTAMKKILQIIIKNKKFQNNLNFIIGNTVSYDTLYYIKKFTNLLGSQNYFMQYFKFLKYLNNDFRSNFLLNLSKLQYSHQFDFCLLLNSNLRLENPLIFSRIRRHSILLQQPIYNIGSNLNNYSFLKHINNNISSVISILEGKHKICNFLSTAKTPLIIFGIDLTLYFKTNFSNFLNILKLNIPNLITNSWNGLFVSSIFSNLVSTLELNLKNFKFNSTNLNSILNIKLNLKNFKYFINKKINDFDQFSKVYYLIEADSLKFLNRIKFNFNYFSKKLNFKLQDFLLIYQGHHNDIMAKQSNLILPNKLFIEKVSYYYNLQGYYQQTRFVINNLKYNRSDIQILKLLVKMISKSILNFNILSITKFFSNENYFSFQNITKNDFHLVIFPINSFNKINNLFFNNLISNYFLVDSYTRASKNLLKTSYKKNK